MAWQVVQTWNWTTQVGSVPFINLGGYNDIHLLFRNVTCTGGGYRSIQVSVNNGLNYMFGGSDYVSIQGNNGEITSSSITLHASASTTARSGNVEINNFNLSGSPKTVQRMSRADIRGLIIPTLSPLNAVLFFDGNGGLLNGGQILIYAR